jgi:sec-independent protein translocase protein TatB
MFDLAWSEIAVIAVVAVVIIGPKDLPEAIRGVAKGVQKLRRMAGEFQQQADELVREAKLDEVRNSIQEVKSTINEIRSFDLKGQIEKAVDADGTLQKTMADDPLRDTFMPPPPAPYVAPELPLAPAAPAFVPPTVARFAAPLPEPAPAPSSSTPPAASV